MEYVVTGTVMLMMVLLAVCAHVGGINKGRELANAAWQQSYERISEDAARLAMKNAELQKRCVALAGRLEDMTRERDEARQ